MNVARKKNAYKVKKLLEKRRYKGMKQDFYNAVFKYNNYNVSIIIKMTTTTENKSRVSKLYQNWCFIGNIDVLNQDEKNNNTDAVSNCFLI